MSAPIGVLLMTFGTAAGAEDVPRYLRSVRGGSEPPDELVAKFRERFAAIGGSPLLQITRQQAAGLQQQLDERAPGDYCVEVGMLHCDPDVETGVQSLVQRGAASAVGLVLAPQYSPLILRGYELAIESARTRHALPIATAKAWHDVPAWIDSLAERFDEAWRQLPPSTHVIFTAHSLPRAAVERDPGYIEQLHSTAGLLRQRAGIAAENSSFAWQSAGHTAQEWLRPDLKELFPQLKQHGCEHVLIAPLQFVSDHLEILYDLDIAARQEAQDCGLEYHRIAMPNASPKFIEALEAVVLRETATAATR